MITINDKSSRTPIFIDRDILNKNEKPSNDYVNSDELDEILSGYITEDELQEIIKEYNNVPYLFIRNDGDIISGDFDAVYDAVKNDKPYLIYVYTFSNSGLYYSPAECVTLVAGNSIQCSYDLTYVALNDETKLLYRVLTISKNGAAISMDQERIIPTEFKTINSKSILGSGNITVQPSLVSGTNIKTINGSSLLGSGDITIEGGGNIVELTQTEYNSITPEDDTLYIITDAPAVEIPDTSNFVDKETLTYEIDAINIALNQKQDTLVSGQNIKTINNQSIVGSGNITIEGGGTEILYLWKLNGTTTYGAAHNASVRNTLLSLSSSEEYPIIVVKDYNNDTICNNVYANASTDYVEIQCCNSRIGGTPNDLTDERYELLPTGMFRYVKNDVVATQNYVDEQIGNINNVLENIIG